MKKTIEINGRKIGPGCPPYVIAEISANHNGDIDQAIRTIRAAYESGADAVKIQTYTADTMTIDCDNEDFLIRGGLWDGYKLYDLYKQAETPFDWHQQLYKYAESLGITIFSTPFDESAVDLLENLRTPAYKVASFEAIDLPLIRRVAETGKPVIISTGMCNFEEIEDAVDEIKKAGSGELILLHCVSSYPAPVEQSNLLQMQNLERNFKCISGLSDHTLGVTVAIAAVALGAKVIEKHFTLSRSLGGVDSQFSLEPSEFKILCREAQNAWLALGVEGFERYESEIGNKQFRRSIYFIRDVVKGEIITEGDIRRIRPGFGLPPKNYQGLLGKKAVKNIERGTPASWDLVEN
jgi:N-acetylneuraminate synthase